MLSSENSSLGKIVERFSNLVFRPPFLSVGDAHTFIGIRYILSFSIIGRKGSQDPTHILAGQSIRKDVKLLMPWYLSREEPNEFRFQN